MRHLRLLVSQTAPGKKVTLKILRDGKEKTLTATLGEMPKEELARGGQAQPGERGESKTDALDGVEVTDLDAPGAARGRHPRQHPRRAGHQRGAGLQRGGGRAAARAMSSSKSTGSRCAARTRRSP